MHIIALVILISVLAVDAFAVSLAYGASKITIPKRSIVIISLMCSLILFLSLYLGVFFRAFIRYPELLASVILFVLGLIKVFESGIKTYIDWIFSPMRAKNQAQQTALGDTNDGAQSQATPAKRSREVTFKLFDLNFLLTVYANPQKADADKSRTISPRESVALSVALSLDNFAAGVGMGLIVPPLLAVGISLVSTPLAILLGLYLGSKLAGFKYDLSMVGGVVLMLVALFL